MLKILASIICCLMSTLLVGQSEYLPATFSAVNISSELRSANEMRLVTFGVGYTNKKNYGIGLSGAIGKFMNIGDGIDAEEFHIGPRAELFIGNGAIITKVSMAYEFGVAKNSNRASIDKVIELNDHSDFDLSISLPVGNKQGTAIFPTIYVGISNRQFSITEINYFDNPRENLLGTFHDEIAISMPVVFNFSGSQVAISPRMGRAVYGEFFEIGILANLYHSARCTVVRRKNKKNSVLSKFYN